MSSTSSTAVAPRRPGRPAAHRALVDEAAVGQRADHAGHGQRRAVAVVDLAADVEGDALRRRPARTQASTAAGSQRQATTAERAPTRSSSRRISVPSPAGAAAGVVGHVGEHDGPAVERRARGATASGTGSAGVDELVAMRPRRARELLGERLGEARVVVGHDVDRRARPPGCRRSGNPAKIEIDTTLRSRSISSAMS